MVKLCRGESGLSSPVVWLGYMAWHSLSFFDRARIVLAAKEYEEVSLRRGVRHAFFQLLAFLYTSSIYVKS
jgi:hypothetical protein